MPVSLPMYDLPELMDAHDAFWRGLRGHLVAQGFAAPPQRLIWPADLNAHWLEPDLLLSQACGYPLKRALKDRVALVGVPVYNAPGCSGILYSSILIVPAASSFQTLPDLESRRAAHNGADSQSGYSALRHAVAPYARNGRFFSTVTGTTRHEESIDLVAEGRADIAAIDSVTFALLQRYQPERVAGIRSIGFTPPVAGLPFITAGARSDAEIARLRVALADAFADSSLAEARAALLLGGIAFPDPGAYDDIDRLEQESIQLGYPVIA